MRIKINYDKNFLFPQDDIPTKVYLKGPNKSFNQIKICRLLFKVSIQNSAGHKLHETSKRDLVINYILFLKKKVVRLFYSDRLNVNLVSKVKKQAD